MAITKVWLDESENECISCGACEAVCPEVFEVPDKMVVKGGVNYDKYASGVEEAAESCPTQVIRYEQG